jgi:hypothetical protein
MPTSRQVTLTLESLAQNKLWPIKNIRMGCHPKKLAHLLQWRPDATKQLWATASADNSTRFTTFGRLRWLKIRAALLWRLIVD